MSTSEAGPAKAGQDEAWRGFRGQRHEADGLDSYADGDERRQRARGSEALVIGSIVLAQLAWVSLLIYFAHGLMA
jgi:hypothetical protein